MGPSDIALLAGQQDWEGSTLVTVLEPPGLVMRAVLCLHVGGEGNGKTGLEAAPSHLA